MQTLGNVVQGNGESAFLNVLAGSVKVTAAAYLAVRYLPKASTNPMMPCYAAAALSLGALPQSRPVSHLSPALERAHWWMVARGLTTVVAGLQLGALLHAARLVTPANKVAAGLTLFASVDLLLNKNLMLRASRNSSLHDLADTQDPLVPALLGRGFDIDSVREDGMTPLLSALEAGRGSLAIRLVEEGANLAAKRDGSTALHFAIEGGDRTCLSMALERCDINAQDSFGDTPIMLALYFGHIEAARRLSDGGADLQIRNNFGSNALHYAADGGNEACIEMVVENFDPNVKNDEGETPLMFAVRAEHLKAAALLIKKGADPQARDLGGETILHRAAKRGSVKGIEMALRHGCDVDAASATGTTPIKGAIAGRHRNAVRLLSQASQRSRSAPIS